LDLSERKQIQKGTHFTGSKEEEKYVGKPVCVLIQMDEDSSDFQVEAVILCKYIFQDGGEENYRKL
jgi:hypothetical protein